VGSGERALPQQKIIGGIKKGSDGKNKLFSSKMCQYLENGKRYAQSYY